MDEFKKEFGYLKQVISAPVSEALICVDTRDGIKYDPATGLISSPNNPYDIQIYTGTSLFAGRVRRIKLKEITLPWNVPNVNERNNVLFAQRESDGAEAQIRIPEGFYTPESLANGSLEPGAFPGLESFLNTNNFLGFNTWVVRWDSTSNTFLIGSGPDPTKKFRILPKNKQTLPAPLTDTLATLMGYQNIGDSYQNNARSAFALMNYTQYVDIVSPFLTKNQYVIDRSTNFKTGNNLIARLYLAPDVLYPISDTGNNIIGTRPFVYHKEFSVPKEINWDMDESLPSINIQLRDDKGDILYVPRGGVNLYDTVLTSIASNSSFVALTFGVSEARGE